MKKPIRWLKRELERWVGGNLITREQADRIAQLYPEPKARLPWNVILFGGLGAVVVGLGLILLIAYNWEAIPKLIKLAIVFVVLLGAHGAGLWLRRRGEQSGSPGTGALGEALNILGTMFFGAGIWLVAQIYNIQEHFPNGFLFWGLGALAAAWALFSTGQAIMAAVLFASWSLAEAIDFRTPVHAAPWMIGGLLGPLAFLKRSRVLLAFLIVAVVFTVGTAVISYEDDIAFSVLLSAAALLVGAGIWLRTRMVFPESGPVFVVSGLIAYFLLAYLLTFPDLARDVIGVDFNGGVGPILYWLVPLLLAIAAWSGVIADTVRRRGIATERFPAYDLFLIPLLLVLTQIAAFLPSEIERWWIAAPINVIVLAHAAGLMARGCLNESVGTMVLGSILFGALTVARYVDLFESLWVRGIVFILVGGVLIGQGLVYHRIRKLHATERATGQTTTGETTT